MSLFSSSSRRGGRNLDGSWRVVCSHCRQFIADSPVKLGKVTCAICTASLEGRVLTAEAIEMYNLSKLGKRDVSLVNLSDEIKTHGAKFTLRSMGSAVMQAFGFPKPDAEPPRSVQVAKSKRRERLFKDVDLDREEPVLGSMIEVDAQLNRAKENQP